MAGRNVVIIDYDMGNIWSVLSALRYLGENPIVTYDPDQLRFADFLVLPGVGSFRKAMESLKSSGLDAAIREAVLKRGVKIIGICLGMQLLGSFGTEDGETEGLSLIPNRVEKFTVKELGNNKVPHIGFNSVQFSEKTGLFLNLPNNADFYFVHSYRMLPDGNDGKYGKCFYGIEFIAALEIQNICGTQFHPEKSQTNGLTLLSNFLEL